MLNTNIINGTGNTGSCTSVEKLPHN